MPRVILAALAATIALVAVLTARPAAAQETFDGAGNLNVTIKGGGTGTAGSVTLAPATGTPNETTVTCGTGSTALLAAASATQFVLVKVPATGGTVWINAAGAAAVAAPPSIDLVAGASILWSPGNGFVPSSAMACIAVVAQAVTLLWK